MTDIRNIFDHGSCLTESEKWAYIEGSLSPNQRHRVEKHLLNCEMCADELEGLQLLGKEKTDAITGNLNKNLLASIAGTRQIGNIVLKRAMATAAALLLIFGLGTLIHHLIPENIEDAKVAQERSVSEPNYAPIGQFTDSLAKMKKASANGSTQAKEQIQAVKTTPKQEPNKAVETKSPAIEHIDVSSPENAYDTETAYIAPSEEEIILKEEIDYQAPIIIQEELEQVNDLAYSETTAKSAKRDNNSDEKSSGMSSEHKKQSPATEKHARRSLAPTSESAQIESRVEDNSPATPFSDTISIQQLYDSGNYNLCIAYAKLVSPENPAYNEIQWILAMSYYKTDNFKDCKIILTRIITSNSTFTLQAQDSLNNIIEK